MRNDEQVADCDGKVLKVGDRILTSDGDPHGAVITEITESDADYDDELQRGVSYPPKVKVTWDNGDPDEFSTWDSTQYSWAMYPDGPDMRTYVCDDIQKEA